MEKNSLGEIIRTLRKKAGLSQEELADGICSSVSISRIENGVQMPSGVILDAILSKLGTGTYQICDIYYKNEKQLAFEKDAEYVTRLISEGNIDTAKEQLLRLEDRAKENNISMQYYLLLDASIKVYDQTKPEEILDILNQALKLSKPEFNFEDFRHTLLTIREANILNVFVVVYYKLNKTGKAIQLGEELMSALQRHKSSLKEYQIITINLAFNLAQCMEKESRYKEALKYGDMAEKLSISSAEQLLLPEIEFIRAKAYHLLGNEDKCIEIIKAIVPYMELIQKLSFAEIVKNYAKNELNIVL